MEKEFDESFDPNGNGNTDVEAFGTGDDSVEGKSTDDATKQIQKKNGLKLTDKQLKKDRLDYCRRFNRQDLNRRVGDHEANAIDAATHVLHKLP